MDIAILGAGGVGGYYGGMLAHAGHRVRMLARGEHLAAIRARGLEVRIPGESFAAPVSGVEHALDLTGAELVVIAVKSYSLAEVLPDIRMLAERGSVVMPLLNGVDTVEQMVAVGVPAAQILGGLTTISAAKVAPGVVERRSSFQRVVVGEPAGGHSHRAERVATLFAQAGVDAHASENITLDLWRKFAFIAAVGAICGLAHDAIGPIRKAPYFDALLERAVREIVAVGSASGVALNENDVTQTIATINGLAEALKPSFLLDLERGGPNELDILSGAVSRMARQLNVATPVHDTATTALSVRRMTAKTTG